MWSCPSCGANVEDSVERCWGCGWRQTPRARDDDAPEPGPRPTESDRVPGEWTCPKCGEGVDPLLDVCWNCGTTADGVEDPHFVREQDAGQTDDDTESEADDVVRIADDDLDAPEVFHPRRVPPHEANHERHPTCHRCGAVMVEGYVAFPSDSERGPFRAVPRTGAWFAGRAWWTRRKKRREDVAFYPLRADRCPACGVIEFFAPD